MIKITNSLKRSSFIKSLGLLFLCFVIVQALVWTIDHRSFPGCVIVGHESGNVLVIKLNEDLATGTDYSCQLAGELIFSICREGYKVRVTNWTISDVIGIERAYRLSLWY